MRAGAVILARLSQADGGTKTRPALRLRRLPPFGDYLACGISSQLRHAVPSSDEIVPTDAADFPQSGLQTTSVIRLGFLAVLPEQHILGTIGHVSSARLKPLLRNLARHLVADLV